ncbi:hypothetical protein [Sulfitobacter sp. MF3-043]|uniref:hypothetical protein n=1 Tax=Sulfitobacter sediminivivens TaxID=3252902 RepID=UPI0036D75DA5
MNTSLYETARQNRTAALETLRLKKQVSQSEGQVLCLRSMREKMATKPVFRSVRVYRFEERRAA